VPVHPLKPRDAARMAAIAAVVGTLTKADRNGQLPSHIGRLSDADFETLAVVIVLAIECKEIEGLSASWAS
jgi:hypothetical protein